MKFSFVMNMTGYRFLTVAQVPGSDVYFGDFQLVEGQLQGITHRPQYQLSFLRDGQQLLLTSTQGEGAQEQTDSVLNALVSGHSQYIAQKICK